VKKSNDYTLQSPDNERNDGAHQDGDADNDIVARMQLVMHPVENCERDQNRQEQQAQRPEHGMTKSPL